MDIGSDSEVSDDEVGDDKVGDNKVGGIEVNENATQDYIKVEVGNSFI